MAGKQEYDAMVTVIVVLFILGILCAAIYKIAKKNQHNSLLTAHNNKLYIMN